jgi:hypothetical protein
MRHASATSHITTETGPRVGGKTRNQARHRLSDVSCCPAPAVLAGRAEAGEAEYVERVKPDEIVWTQGGLKLRVLSPVKEDGDTYTGC